MSDLPVEVARQIDALCDAYESLLVADLAAEISPFLNKVDPPWRTVLERELIALARERADPPTRRPAEGPNRAGVAPGLRTGAASPLRMPCPACGSSLEIQPESDLAELRCGVCGQSFKPSDGQQATRDARAVGEIEHFDLVEQVGVGAFGAVWKAFDRRLQRTVAIKFGRRGQFDAQQQANLVREAQAAAQLNHPGIVPVFEVGSHGDTFFIVSEYVRGLTLSEWAASQRPNQRDVAEVVIDLAEALHHAHERGVVHRDIKPGNIMIVDDGTPKLMDFGLAKRDSADGTVTADGHVVGTPAYMSPEQARGDSNVADRRSDIYSLGVVLYQLLTGELPFQGNPRLLLHQVLHADPPSVRDRNPGVPRELESIVMRCLAKDPPKRHTTALSLADELRSWIAGGKNMGHADSTDAGDRKRWLLPVLVTAALLVAVGAIGLYAIIKSGPETVEPTPSPFDQEIQQAERVNRRLQSEIADEIRKLKDLQREIERLSPPLGSSARWPSKLPRSVENLCGRSLGPFAAVGESVAWLLTAQLHGANEATVVSTTEAAPLAGAEAEQQRLQQLLNENVALESELKQLQSAVAAAAQRVELLKAFADATLILSEGDAGAVALNKRGDDFTVAAIGRIADMPLISRMVQASGRQILRDHGALARELKQLKVGARVTLAEHVERLDRIYRPRKYVPDGCRTDQMVAIRRSDLQGEYVIGYLLSHDDQRLTLASTSLTEDPLGEKVFLRKDVVGYPIVGEGVELLQMEPGVKFADYAILRAARELATPGPAVHQAVAVQTVVRVNPALLKSLSAYSVESDISWLAVAADHALLRDLTASDGLRSQGPRYRAAMEVLAQALESDLTQAASNLGIPLVTRDRDALLRMTEEDRIRRGGSPLPRAEFTLRAMREAANRGGLAYGYIEHEGITRRVVMLQEDTQGFESAARQWGQSQFRRADASAGAAVGARGYAFGGGGGGGYRRGRLGGGAGYGYGGGGASASMGAAASASAAREDFLYSDGQLYESHGKQTYLDDLSDDQARDAYQSVVFAEQAAKRDAELTLMDYGRLVHATHVLRIDVTQGRSDDAIRYKVSLQKIDGASKQLGAVEVPINSSRQAGGAYLASCDLMVINPKVRDRVRYEPLRIDPRPTERREYPPAFVMQRLTSPSGKLLGLRHLFETRLVTRENKRGWAQLGDLVDRERGGDPTPVSAGSSLDKIPENHRMRVAIHEIMRHVCPLAGEVVAVDSERQTAEVRINDPYQRWKPGQRLTVERPTSGRALDYLPFDLRVDRNDDGLVTVKYDSDAEVLWSPGGGLRVGDRVAARADKELKIGVRSPWFFFTDIQTWEEFRLDPEARNVASNDFPLSAIPDDNAVRLIYKRTGWRKVKGELQNAAASLPQQLISGLVQEGVNATRYDGNEAANIDKLIHMELVPYARGTVRYELAYRLNIEIRTPTAQQPILSFDVDPALLGTWSAITR